MAAAAAPAAAAHYMTLSREAQQRADQQVAVHRAEAHRQLMMPA
jgi:hypothetical protein